MWRWRILAAVLLAHWPATGQIEDASRLNQHRVRNLATDSLEAN
jgi:hypothetical protein